MQFEQERSFDLMIDYSQTLEQMISVGNYDWSHNDIRAKYFFVKGEGRVSCKVKLVHFNRRIYLEEAISELGKANKRPANIEELLAFGAQYPEIQRQFPVLAIGSSAEINGDRGVAYLCGKSSERNLYLDLWVADQHPICRFLVCDK